MEDWSEVESVASLECSWSAVDVPQEDWSELGSVASVRSLATALEDPSTCDLGSRGPSPLSFDGESEISFADEPSPLSFVDETTIFDDTMSDDAGSVCTASGWPRVSDARGPGRIGEARAGAHSYRDALLSVTLPSLDTLMIPPPCADGPALVALPVATGRGLRRRGKALKRDASKAGARAPGLRMCMGPRGSRRRLIPLTPIKESAPRGNIDDDDETQGSLSDSGSDSGCAQRYRDCGHGDF